MFKKQIALLILIAMVSLPSLAADNLYSVFSAAYADIKLNQGSNKSLGYKIAMGYEFDPQWYIEAGYQQLIHNSSYSNELPTTADIIHHKNLQQGDALFLAFLGKASG